MTNSPFPACKHYGICDQWKGSSWNMFFIDRFCLAWHFPSVTSNQATGTESAKLINRSGVEQTNYTDTSNELWSGYFVVRMWFDFDQTQLTEELETLSLQGFPWNLDISKCWSTEERFEIHVPKHLANVWCECSHMTGAAAFCFVSPTHSTAWLVKRNWNIWKMEQCNVFAFDPNQVKLQIRKPVILIQLRLWVLAASVSRKLAIMTFSSFLVFDITQLAATFCNHFSETCRKMGFRVQC